MDILQDALDAAIDQVVQVVVAGFGQTVADHEASRALGEQVREGAASQALLGPTLDRFAQELLGEVGRRTIERYAARRQHPTYSPEQLINEAEDADRTLNVAIGAAIKAKSKAKAGGNPWLRNLGLEVAILRVRSITNAIGLDCIYPERDAPNLKDVDSRQRRRPITAADIPAAIADVLVRGQDEVDDLAGTIAGLRALERGDANAGALVTKLLALLEHPKGQAHLNTVVTTLRRAQFGRNAERDQQAAKPTAVAPANPNKPAGRVAGPKGAETLPADASPGIDRSGGRDVDPSPSKARQSLAERFRQTGGNPPSVSDLLKQSHARHRKRNA